MSNEDFIAFAKLHCELLVVNLRTVRAPSPGDGNISTALCSYSEFSWVTLRKGSLPIPAVIGNLLLMTSISHMLWPQFFFL